MKNRTTALLLTLVFLISSALYGCKEQSDNDISETASDTVSELNVYCFDAGKADSFLLYTDDSAVLIDAGESGFGKTIAAKCGELGIEKLDYLIITHFDKDHVGGAKKVIEELTIDNVLQSNCPKESSEYDKYISALESKNIDAVTVREELSFSLDDVDYIVDPPKQETYTDPDQESNNSSLITSIQFGDNKMLFTGDAENDRLTEYLSDHSGHYDLVKIPHHGQWQKSLKDLIASTTPKDAIITSSDEEPEDEKTLDLLGSYNTNYYLTRTAPILITSDGSTITISYVQQDT